MSTKDDELARRVRDDMARGVSPAESIRRTVREALADVLFTDPTVKAIYLRQHGVDDDPHDVN